MEDVVLRAEHLTKRYGTLTAVDDVSLDVLEGEVFGLLGPNGAGKTTTMSMICGLLRPDGGRVLVRGREVRAGADDTRLDIGVCPQNIVIWGSLTCREQLEFVGQMCGLARALAQTRGDDLLAALGLFDRRDSQARTLSGGMQRRLNLALALVHDPKILVLDEPEVGLDPQSRVLVREYIHALAHRKTVIFTTHNMDEADRLADRVGIVDHGKLIALGAPETLKRTVGEGDVLEIELGALDAELESRVRRSVEAIAPQARVVDGRLVVRTPSAIRELSGIVEALEGIGVAPGEIRLRENTLEDVFIALTGRRLREV